MAARNWLLVTPRTDERGRILRQCQGAYSGCCHRPPGMCVRVNCQRARRRVTDRDGGPNSTSCPRCSRTEIVECGSHSCFAGVPGQADQKLFHFDALPGTAQEARAGEAEVIAER